METSRTVFPFHLVIDPMERLIVADLKSDPEFKALEFQTFDDGRNGHGMRVLRYRHDGRVDVYLQSGVILDRTTFAIGKGLVEVAEAEMEPCLFEISPQGVRLDVGFVDVAGRRVELRIAESAEGKRGFPMLAPVGADISDPKMLFLVFMPTIDLVRVGGTLVDGRIGDRPIKPAVMPLLLNGARVFLIRYGEKPIIANLNPNGGQPVVLTSEGTGPVRVGASTYELGPGACVQAVRSDGPSGSAEIRFDPPYPNLEALPDQTVREGSWSIALNGVPMTGGTYGLSRWSETIDLRLNVTMPWVPHNLPIEMWLFTQIVRKFRLWPTSYAWEGTATLGPSPALVGAWRRK
jgi:hypothetical protein